MPFKEMIISILEKSNIVINDDEKVSDLADKISTKVLDIVKIIVDDKDLEKLKDFDEYHNYFVQAILKSTSYMDKEDLVPLLFSISNALIVLSTLSACSGLKEYDEFIEVYKEYEERLKRISIKTNFAIMTCEIDMIKGDEGKEKCDREYLINLFDKCIKT